VLSILVLLTLAAASSLAQAQQSAPGPQPFAEWLQEFRAEAEAKGISPATLDLALNGLEPQPLVIERDRSQRELTLTVREYVKRRVTKSVIRTAQRARRRHATLLARVEKAYGVSPEFVVAVWALESNFGRFSGVRPTIQALATLAWEGRRGRLFRDELIAALRILDRGEVDPARLRGSWAGAMGQVQFLPSSYDQFAQDFDGDGRKDIWKSLPDVFASIANYLRESGWTSRMRWGVRVRLPPRRSEGLRALMQPRAQGYRAELDLSVPAPVRAWRNAHVQLTRSLPLASSASLVTLGNASFLVTKNYEAILDYNCAHSYAMSVVELADAIRSQ
jgi:membrane-bound lytic murein transglycosylase B